MRMERWARGWMSGTVRMARIAVGVGGVVVGCTRQGGRSTLVCVVVIVGGSVTVMKRRRRQRAALVVVRVVVSCVGGMRRMVRRIAALGRLMVGKHGAMGRAGHGCSRHGLRARKVGPHGYMAVRVRMHAVAFELIGVAVVWMRRVGVVVRHSGQRRRRRSSRAGSRDARSRRRRWSENVRGAGRQLGREQGG
jgi:hypothetical protein